MPDDWGEHFTHDEDRGRLVAAEQGGTMTEEKVAGLIQKEWGPGYRLVGVKHYYHGTTLSGRRLFFRKGTTDA